MALHAHGGVFSLFSSLNSSICCSCGGDPLLHNSARKLQFVASSPQIAVLSELSSWSSSRRCPALSLFESWRWMRVLWLPIQATSGGFCWCSFVVALSSQCASERWWYETKVWKRRLLSLRKASLLFQLLIILSVILKHLCIRFISVENNVLFMYVTGLFLLGAACVNKKKKNEKDPIIFLSSSSVSLLFWLNSLPHCSLWAWIMLIRSPQRSSPSESREFLSEFRDQGLLHFSRSMSQWVFLAVTDFCVRNVILSFDSIKKEKQKNS